MIWISWHRTSCGLFLTGACKTWSMHTCQMSVLLPTVHQYLRCCAAVCYLIRLFSIQEESSALKYCQYYAFNSFPPGPVGERERRERKGRQKQKDSYGKSEISQDKSPLLNSCHDSLDNNLHYPSPKTHLKAFTIPLPSDFTGWRCVAAYKPLHCPNTCWMLFNASVLD